MEGRVGLGVDGPGGLEELKEAEGDGIVANVVVVVVIVWVVSSAFVCVS